MRDYSDRPTIVVGWMEDGLAGVTFEGFTPPENLRVILRDWTAGVEPDESGDIYEDSEV